MFELIRESLDKQVVRADPIPNAPAHQQYVGLERLSRDELITQLNWYMDRFNIQLRSWSVEKLCQAAIDKSLLPSQQDTYEGRTWRMMHAEYKARIEYYENLNRLKDLKAHNADLELREEIIEALMKEGRARHVAANLTNTPSKMLYEGKRVGII